jgi:hypothetical protein
MKFCYPIQAYYDKEEITVVKSFYSKVAWSLYYTTCLYSSVWGLGQSLPEWSTFQVLHLRVRFWPHPQTLDQAGKACQGQTL